MPIPVLSHFAPRTGRGRAEHRIHAASSIGWRRAGSDPGRQVEPCGGTASARSILWTMIVCSHGDAVMTQAGIKIFVGYSSGHHQPEDFRKISEIKKLSKRERSALAALDASSVKPGGQTMASGMVTGRSASENQLTPGKPSQIPMADDPLCRALSVASRAAIGVRCPTGNKSPFASPLRLR